MPEPVTDTKSAVCYNCSKLVPVPDLRFVILDGETAVPLCSECRTKTRQKVHAKKKVEEGRQPRNINRPEYYCERCRFKFKFDPKGKMDFRCPYCGKADKARRYAVPEAEKLIKESEGYM